MFINVLDTEIFTSKYANKISPKTCNVEDTAICDIFKDNALKMRNRNFIACLNCEKYYLLKSRFGNIDKMKGHGRYGTECNYCGKLIPRNSNPTKKRYCSDECREAARKQKIEIRRKNKDSGSKRSLHKMPE